MSVESRLSVRTLMSPFDDTTAAFLAFVGAAKTSIAINIYGFHLSKLTDLLIAKHQAGLVVSVILDHSQASGRAEASEVARLVEAGVPLLIGTSPVHGQILHLKATTIDGERVTHGSWNYSESASSQLNDLHFVDDKDYAAFYLRHHDAIRSFILLHEMAYQPKGEVAAPAALPEDPQDEEEPEEKKAVAA